MYFKIVGDLPLLRNSCGGEAAVVASGSSDERRKMPVISSVTVGCTYIHVAVNTAPHTLYTT